MVFFSYGGEVCCTHSLHKFINPDWKLESQPPAVCVSMSCSEALRTLTLLAQLKREWQTFTSHTLCCRDYFSAARQPGVRPGSDNARLCKPGSPCFYFPPVSFLPLTKNKAFGLLFFPAFFFLRATIYIRIFFSGNLNICLRAVTRVLS